MKIGFCIAAFIVGCLFAVLVRSGNQEAQAEDPSKSPTHAIQPTAREDSTTPAMLLNIAQHPFGIHDGQSVSRFVCSNENGLSFEVINWGAAIVAVNSKDRVGNFENVILNCEGLEGYQACESYFGATIGRFANHIANGMFSLDGQRHSLSLNDYNNHLHGGNEGFDKRIWATEEIIDADSVGVRMSLTSPDGDQGYPGKCRVSVTYLLNNEDQLSIEYESQTDSPTPINLANQIFWNLDGDTTDSVASHQLLIDADQRLILDEQLIPTGETQPVVDTRFDFRQLTTVGNFDYWSSPPASIDQPPIIAETFNGFNEHFVLNSQSGTLAFAARLISPRSGRKLEVWTTQPGLCLDSGNLMDGLPASGGMQKHAGISLRTQHHPDSPNRPEFPSTILRPNQTYKQTTVFSFSIAQ